jgi:hypothetical protein
MFRARYFITSYFRKLAKIPIRKIKASNGIIYFSTTSAEDMSKAMELLNNYVFKGKPLSAKRVSNLEYRPPTVILYSCIRDMKKFTERRR